MQSEVGGNRHAEWIPRGPQGGCKGAAPPAGPAELAPLPTKATDEGGPFLVDRVVVVWWLYGGVRWY
jgi:hypothetical protein